MKNHTLRNSKLILIVLLLFFAFPRTALGDEIQISVTIPTITASPYHRPYVAVWLETADRKGLKTLAVWHEQEEWLRDMRQWWRKLGRKNTLAYDSVTGATRKPGTYLVDWDGTLDDGDTLPPGDYLIGVEAAREEGGRDFLRQVVSIGKDKQQNYVLQGKKELGEIEISITPQ